VKTSLTIKPDAQYWIRRLELEPHPEGGYFKQTYQSMEHVSDRELSVTFEGTRMLATSIYFLLTTAEVSHFHRLQSDELWYYHGGRPLTVYVIHPNGALESIHLGLQFDEGQVPQATVPAGCIFGSALIPDAQHDDDYSLVGCMVTPGFDYRDFELFTREQLLRQYPQHRDIVTRLTVEPELPG
jgi:uncharacterized protein